MSAFDRILETARATPRRIVLPEGTDPRIAEGAAMAARDGLARPVLLGTDDEVRTALDGADVEVIDPATSPDAARYAAAFHQARKHKGVDEAAAREAVRSPLAFAALMVREGDADGSVAGAATATADVVRTAMQLIGPARGVRTISSFFLMLDPAGERPLAFADCGLVIAPAPDELAAIAVSTAASFERLIGEASRVAMLSFSTRGSARHERVDAVVEALRLAKEAAPDLAIDGELQFDAAFVPSVAESKAPGSPVAGQANVMVFPDLGAGNIAYKIAQRIGGLTALGPILQGLAKPANDLSRGCSAGDVRDMIAVTAAQAAA